MVVPTLGFKPGANILSEGNLNIVLDRNPVFVIQIDEVSEFLSTRQRHRLVADAFLQAAVPGHHINVVVKGAFAGSRVRVQQPAQTALFHRHADRSRDAGAQRSGGHFHTGLVTVFGMAGQ